MQNYHDIIDFFEKLQRDCFLSFMEVHTIREKIVNDKFTSQDLIILKSIFTKWQNEDFLDFVKGGQLFEDLLKKKIDFFSSNSFYEGNFISRGKVDFFSYAELEFSNQALLLSYLPIMRKQMEKAWYGLLQKYAKVIINLSKYDYK